MLTPARPKSVHSKAHHPRTQEDMLHGNSPGDRESLGLLGGETFPVFSSHLYSPFTRVYSTQDDCVPRAEDNQFFSVGRSRALTSSQHDRLFDPHPDDEAPRRV